SSTTTWKAPGALTDVYPGASYNTGYLNGNGDQTVTIILDPATVNQALADNSGSLSLLLAGESLDKSVSLYSGTHATASKHPVLTIVTGIPGAAPAVSLSASTLTFASQNIGSSSAVQPVTLTNAGTGPLSITS